MRLPLLGERDEGTRGKGEEEMGHMAAVEKAKGEKIPSKRRSLLFLPANFFLNLKRREGGNVLYCSGSCLLSLSLIKPD